MFPTDFEPRPALTDGIFGIARLRARDFEGLYEIARHPVVWAGHPAANRHERDVFEAYFDSLLQTETALLITEFETKDVIGTSSYYEAPDIAGTISIGYTFLGHEYWSGFVNFSVKKLMHAHAFQSVDTIWYHIAPDNIRSQKATAKLGAKHQYDAELLIAGNKVMTKCYSLTRADWDAVVLARGED